MGKIAAIIDNKINTNDLNKNDEDNDNQQQQKHRTEHDLHKSSISKMNGFINTSSTTSNNTNNVKKRNKNNRLNENNNEKNNNNRSLKKNKKSIEMKKNLIKNIRKRKRIRNSNGVPMSSTTTSSSSSITNESNATSASNTNNQKKLSSYQDQTNILTYFDPNKKIRDPLAMVECHQFDDTIQPPVVVKIKLEALILMDLHAHCSHNEIIGCLGGYYCRVTKTLYVLKAIPGSLVEGHYNQCELDPVSYIDSLDLMEKHNNLQMVGWYHSHPKFLAKPSIIDIQTQKYNQGVFYQRYSKKKDIDINNNDDNDDEETINQKTQQIDESERTFVGFIITPFLVKPNISSTLTSSKSFQRYQPHSERSIGSKFIANDICYDYHHSHYSSYCYFTPELNSLLASTIKCFWVSGPQYSKDPMKNNPQRMNCLVPYEIETTMIRDECFISSIANGLSKMCIKLFSNSDDRNSIVDLFKQFTRIGSININYLEKIVASLTHHLQNPSVNYLCTEEEFARIRDQCVAILTQELLDGNRKTLGRIHHHRYR